MCCRVKMLKLVQRLSLPSSNKIIFHQTSRTCSAAATQENSEITKSNPLEHYDYFGVNKLFTVKHLFDNRMHLGHTQRSLTEGMAPFVYGTRYEYLLFLADFCYQLCHFSHFLFINLGAMTLITG